MLPKYLDKEKLQRAFGQTIRTLRTKKHLSQEELADRSGLHRTYIGDIERGARNIALKNVFCLSAALEITPEQLMRLVSKHLNKTAPKR